jgi:hypothetical protein
MKKIIIFSLSIFFGISVFTACKKEDEQATPISTNTEWSKSFDPGYIDNSGKFAGGNEIMQIIAHKGKLYAGNSYWMEPNASVSSAEILRLDNSNAQWQVDKEFTLASDRVNSMKSVIFTTDGLGNAITPDTILVAIPVDDSGNGIVYTRNDISNTWVKSLTLPIAVNFSVRAIGMYKDKATNIDKVFFGAKDLGIFSGVYEPTLPGKIKWNTNPEFVTQDAKRVLSFTECNGSLYFSTQKDVGANKQGLIYKRLDGTIPTWQLIYTTPTIGGSSENLRGLTSIKNPTGSGEC